MIPVIFIFAVVTFSAGAAIFTHPGKICGYLQQRADLLLVHILNIVVRIVFGIAMLSRTEMSHFPLLTDIVGWFCLGIAVFLTLVGRKRFIRGFSWAVQLMEKNNRIAGFLVMALGAFLIGSFV